MGTDCELCMNVPASAQWCMRSYHKQFMPIYCASFDSENFYSHLHRCSLKLLLARLFTFPLSIRPVYLFLPVYLFDSAYLFDYAYLYAFRDSIFFIFHFSGSPPFQHSHIICSSLPPKKCRVGTIKSAHPKGYPCAQSCVNAFTHPLMRT